MKPSLLITLYEIAETAGSIGEATCTTTEIAKKLGFSQQTASRHLIELEKLGHIKRMKAARGELVQITPKGSEQLSLMYLTLQRIFEGPKREVLIEGEVFTGLGEGAYYVSQLGYRRQFIEKLGFDPYPGTLNLKIGKQSQRERKLIDTYPSTTLEGFMNGTRSFGQVKCYRARLNDKVDGVVITALRTHYGEDVLEVVAPKNLREVLGLKDGDSVKVRVFISTPQ